MALEQPSIRVAVERVGDLVRETSDSLLQVVGFRSGRNRPEEHNLEGGQRVLVKVVYDRE